METVDYGYIMRKFCKLNGIRGNISAEMNPIHDAKNMLKYFQSMLFKIYSELQSFVFLKTLK